MGLFKPILVGVAPTLDESEIIRSHKHYWTALTNPPDTATRWPTWEEVTGKPAIPDTADFVTLAGAQTISGAKTFSTAQVFQGNIEQTAGWFISSVGTRMGLGGLPNLSGSILQVYGSADIDGGSLNFRSGANVNNVLYTGGSETMILRNFGTEPSTLLEIRSKVGNPTSDIREATLALTRTDDAGNAEFIDIYNNGYHTGSPASVQHGIRIQKRGTGQYRPFVFDWYDGTTYTDGFTADSSTGFDFSLGVSLTGSKITLNAGGTGRVSGTTNPELVEWAGGTSSFYIGVQDGNGRVQFKWNATEGTDETYLVGGEPATKWHMDRVEAFGVYSAPNAAASGDPITWTQNFQVTDSGDVSWGGSLTSGSVPWARLTNVPSTFPPSAHTHDYLGNTVNTWHNDSQGNPRFYLTHAGEASNGVIFRGSHPSHHFQFRNSANSVVWQIGHEGTLEIGSVPWARLTGIPDYLPLFGGTLTGDLTMGGNDIIWSAVGSNAAPVTNGLKVSGYGLLGNRSAFYITNATAGGNILFGIGGVHNAATVATLDSSGNLTLTGAQIRLNGGNGQVLFTDGAGTVESRVYGDTSGSVGFLNAGGSWIFRVSQTGQLDAGSVPWARLTGIPSFASRWPAWTEVTSKPNVAEMEHAHATASTTGWYTIAEGAARNHARFVVSDASSGRHNIVVLKASGSYGQFSVDCLHGLRFGTRTIAHARIIYPTADRTYGTYKLQVYLENTPGRVDVLLHEDAILSNGWGNWTLVTPVLENTPSGYSEDSNARIDDITRQTGGNATFGYLSANAGSFPWSGLTGVPSTFTPSAHAHTWDDINTASVNGWGSLRITANGGYIDFGPANASHAHIYTDRPSFYFNKTLKVNNVDVSLDNHTHDYLPLSGGTLTGDLNGINFDCISGHGRGLRFWDSDSYKIYMSGRTSEPYGCAELDTTGDYNMYFRMTGATDRGFVFWNGSHSATAAAQITGTGDLHVRENIIAGANITAYSDIRLKENIETIQNALYKVERMRGVYFTRKADESKRRHVGLVAQELQAVLPEAVFEGSGDKLTVDYGNVVGLLVEAIKGLSAKVERLEARVH